MDKTREGWRTMLSCAIENQQNTDIEINREGTTVRQVASLWRAQTNSALRCLHSVEMLTLAEQLAVQGQEQPQAQEEPQGQEQPQAQEEPQGQEQPQAQEEPQGQEQPQAQEEPQGQEQPQAQEEPQGQEQPQVQEEPQGQ
ncbi:hydroxysteroid dehydrogenase-like protein 2 [Drosophila miranda]|uniref:hydroxysteroid dehydrogenase-like protein 2 n=1 Tax=Drosophila miranda TaxID=7229 RepID=UPI0007E85D1D|nr:hydroxysteroid dehydrogenase-like protein 2 [Drosophila miranda]XP_017152994.1 hydroxysteroid dehydrogenase-like protein 2 [Drosophila miranda]